MPIWRQACGLSLRCRLYIFYWHSSLLFTFYKAQKYKDFLKRQNVSTFFYQFNQKKSRRARALRDERYVEEMYYSSIQFSIVIPSTRLKCFALFVTIIILLTIDVQAIIRSKSMILKPRCLSLNLSFA